MSAFKSSRSAKHSLSNYSLPKVSSYKDKSELVIGKCYMPIKGIYKNIDLGKYIGYVSSTEPKKNKYNFQQKFINLNTDDYTEYFKLVTCDNGINDLTTSLSHLGGKRRKTIRRKTIRRKTIRRRK